MIKIKKEDSIVDILKKISKSKSEEIILDFPFWHPVLHNHLSLKIIQTKTRNKKLSIISNDKTAKKIAKILGIKFLKNKKNKSKKNITTQDILKHNFTFLEYAKFEIKLFLQKIIFFVKWNIKSNKKINNIFYIKNKYWEQNKNIIFYFILMLILIFLLLLYIYYIAINKTYITIYPEINLNTKSKNFIFIENNNNNNEKENYYFNNKIYINKISKKITLNKKIATSWIKQKKENLSKWKAIFYNYLPEKIYLLKNTTLENKEWVQFYLPENINIPPSNISNWKITPWEKEVLLYWKIKLLNWDYSWLKTNIWTWVLLTIPKLGENKTKIFAKSITKFNWWSNKFTNFLTKKDIENARILIKDTLKEIAISKIKKDIEKNNKQNSIQVDLLPIDNIFKFTNLKINIPEYLKIWDEIKDFNISWEIEITSYTYNKQAVISLLKNSINNNLIKNYQKIISIDENSLRIAHIIKRNDLKKINWKYFYSQKSNQPLIIKATTEIEYYLSKKFENKNSNFMQQIKHQIAWKSIEEAEKILTNKSEINDVRIRIQPFFIKKISTLLENIEIIIKE